MKHVVLTRPDLVGPWVAERTGGEWTGRGQAFGLVDDTKLIAGVILDAYNGASIMMHVAAEPGSRWLNRNFLWACFSYPFDQLKVKKIIGLVGEGNTAARKFDENLGFVLETTLKDAHPDGSLLIYTMNREQCRWLNILKENHVQAQSSPSS